MARERFDSITARIPARITSALARGRELSERRLEERRSMTVPVVLVEGQEQAIECLDTRIFNQSVSRKWVEDPNPREDAWSPRPSRLDPSA